MTLIFHALISKGWGELRRLDWGSQGLHACSWLQDLRGRCLLRLVIKKTLEKSDSARTAWPWTDIFKMNFLAKISLRQLPRVSTRPPIYPTSPSNTLPTTSLHTGQTVFGTFEPDYLDTEGSTIPTYPPLNIQVPKMCRWLGVTLYPRSDQGIQLWLIGRVPELGPSNGREHGNPSYMHATIFDHQWLETTRV